MILTLGTNYFFSEAFISLLKYEYLLLEVMMMYSESVSDIFLFPYFCMLM